MMWTPGCPICRFSEANHPNMAPVCPYWLVRLASHFFNMDVGDE